MLHIQPVHLPNLIDIRPIPLSKSLGMEMEGILTTIEKHSPIAPDCLLNFISCSCIAKAVQQPERVKNEVAFARVVF